MVNDTRYKLRYHFSIISLIAIIVSAVSLSIYYRQSTINQLIEFEERNHIALTPA